MLPAQGGDAPGRQAVPTVSGVPARLGSEHRDTPKITTCSGMTTVAFRLYSEGLAQRRPEEAQMNETDTVGGYAVPVDPMDDLQCESCQ